MEERVLVVSIKESIVVACSDVLRLWAVAFLHEGLTMPKPEGHQSLNQNGHHPF